MVSSAVRCPIARPDLPRTSFERIGILLLRHHAAARRRSISQLEVAELLARHQDEVFGEAAQVHHGERRGVDKARGEITIGRSVDAVADAAAEAETRGERVDVDAVAGAGDGA